VIITDEERHAFLAKQPVAALQIDADTHRRLRQLGLNVLGDLARLPEAALVSQFGHEGRRLWQLATGLNASPVTGRRTPEPIVSTLDFAHPIADRAMLKHSLSRLIERALRHPQRSGWRVQQVRARATLANGGSWMASATLNEPTANRDHIAAPIEVRIEQLPPAGAVETLTVEFTAFVHGVDELQLFARDAASAARAGRQRALRSVVKEIKVKFNRSGLYHIVEVQPWSRIPERRYALIDYDP
jgi:DNA polymerase-4/protein ImuB